MTSPIHGRSERRKERRASDERRDSAGRRSHDAGAPERRGGGERRATHLGPPDRRRRIERRELDGAPPGGWRERRRTVDRRQPEVAEVSADEFEVWARFFKTQQRPANENRQHEHDGHLDKLIIRE